MYMEETTLLKLPEKEQLASQGSYRQVWVNFKDFSRTSKIFPTFFQGLKFMKNTDLSVEILLQRCLTELMEKWVLKISIKMLCLHLVQHMLHQIKAQQFYTDFGLYQLC